MNELNYVAFENPACLYELTMLEISTAIPDMATNDLPISLNIVLFILYPSILKTPPAISIKMKKKEATVKEIAPIEST